MSQQLFSREIIRLLFYGSLLLGIIQCQLFEERPLFEEKYASGATKTEVFKNQYNKYLVRKYFECGKIMQEYTANDSVFHGWYICFFENGKMQSKVFINNGKVDGGKWVFYSNGQVQSIENYKNGKLNDFATYFDSLGNVEQVVFYVNEVPRYTCEYKYDSLKLKFNSFEEYNPKIVLSSDTIYSGKNFYASLDFELPVKYFNLNNLRISLDIAEGQKVSGKYVLSDKPELFPALGVSFKFKINGPGEKIIIGKVYDSATKRGLGENFIERKILVKEQLNR